MFSRLDLMMPGRTGWISLMTTQTIAILEFGGRRYRVVNVRLPGAVTGFARNGLMLRFVELFPHLRMALVTGPVASINRRARCNLL
jgi:hypothetical protein